MNSSQTEEWDDMTETRQNEIRANVRARLFAACDTNADVTASIVRDQLERASRSGLAARLAKRGH